MEQNHIAQCAFAPEAATHEPASSTHAVLSGAEGPERSLPPRYGEFEFATEAEADAYWAGVADGIRSEGGIPAPRLAARARDHYPELVATREERLNRDIIDFDTVSVRHRIDGWTPEKQREYVEALADSGVARYAAGRVGMSEQSAARLRRRPDARSFDRACAAALRISARRLVSIAFERAIEGTIKRHTYHGEIVSEERVYDNRLLMSLIGKLPDLFEPGAEAVERDWPDWMEAIELGLPEPRKQPAPVQRAAMEPPPDEWTGEEVWEDPDGIWWTSFPPPPGFDGEVGTDMLGCGYERTLTPVEQAVIDAEVAAEDAEKLAEQAARRDRYFGFTPQVFPPKGCETYETSAEAADDSDAIGQLAERTAGGSADMNQPNPSDDAALPRRSTQPHEPEWPRDEPSATGDP